MCDWVFCCAFSSIDPTKSMKWHVGERVENFFESSHFERFKNLGLKRKLVGAYSLIILLHYDYGFDTFLELSKDDLDEFLPKSIKLVDHDTFINFQKNEFPSKYFLCEEDTDALISDKRLMTIICNDSRIIKKANFYNKTIFERELNLNLVYFPEAQILWVNFKKW